MIAAELPWLAKQRQWFEHCLTSDRLPHAILLCGDKGLGKRLFARQIAEQLLVHRLGEKQQTQAAAQWAAGSHPDFHLVAVDEGKKDIAIDQIRDLIEHLQLTSFYSGHRAAIIEPADAMSISATNSLLKCLEEPPKGTVLILIADKPAAIKATIRSRCQLVQFSAPETQLSVDWLSSQGDFEASNVTSSLNFCGGAPLAALAMLNAEENPLNEWEAGLLAVCRGQKTPMAVAADIAKTEAVPDWLKWCQLITLEAYKHSVGLTTNPVPSAIVDVITAAPNERRNAYLGELQQLRRLANTPVAKQGLLEAALIPWTIGLRTDAANRFALNG